MSEAQAKPSEMVERVARALEPLSWAALGSGDTLVHKTRRTSSLRKARAAIEAMREPTRNMKRYGSFTEVTPVEGAYTQEIGEFAAAEAYTAMIDAALSSTGEKG